MKVKFSIVVPVYNTSKYLKKNIESILDQTYDNFELIIINDGSTDDSLKIIEDYAKKDKRIKVINKENTGVSDTRNIGVSNAKGNYLCFVDSDDYLDSSFLEKISLIIGDKQPDLIRVAYNEVYEDGSIVKSIRNDNFKTENGINAFLNYVKNNAVIDVPWIFVYNLDYYKKNNFMFEKGTFHEDFGLLPEVLVKANEVVNTNAIYNYLINRKGSTMSNVDKDFIWKKALDVLKNYDKLVKNVLEANVLKGREKEYFKHYIDNAIIYKFSMLDKKQAKDYKKMLKEREIFKIDFNLGIKMFIKKTILNISPKLYIRLFLKSKKKDKKVLFVSSTGGHLDELMQLKGMFSKYNYYIVTEKTKSNLSLKEKYPKKVSFFVYGTKDKKLVYPFKLFINTIKALFIYLKVRPKYIISTGAHTGGIMCLIGKIFGSKIIFIETFANSKTKSVTGKLVYKFADLFIVQWQSMLELYPDAVYGGWIY